MSEGRRKAPGRAHPKRHWALRVAGWLLALFFVGVIGAAATFFIGYQTTDIPDPNKEFATNTTTVYYANGKSVMGTFYEQNRRSVPLKEIPKTVQDAVTAAEDRSFWTNPGVSPSGMARAAWNIARGEQLQGGSTITQQYVKIMYLTQERTFSRKFSELFIATKLSRQTDKKQILEGYLNTIYFGEGAYGIAAAGDAYFKVPDPKNLSIPQAAFLATVLNNPGLFDPDDGKTAAKLTLDRYRYVLSGMLQTGTITKKQHDEYAKALPPRNKKAKSNRYQGAQGFLLDMARRELRRYGFDDDEISGGGLRVTTTFDLGLQGKAIDAINEKSAHPKKTKNLHIGIASVRPNTGELVAMYGGPDYLKSQLNWATARARPGSAFKPFAVAAALGDGKTLKDRFQGNGPIEVRGGEYDNELGEDYGPVSLLKATEKSVNTAFYDLVDNQMEGGPGKVADMAEAAGIPKIPESDRNAPSLVLGPNAYASPVEMAGAYATFATNGRHTPVHAIKEVKDASGTVKWSDKSLKSNQAIDENIAKTTSYALQQVVEDDGGTGRRAQELGRPAAGKTGTAGGLSVEKRRVNAACKCKRYEDGDDTLTSWWVGYTPQLSTAVLYRAGPGGESDLDDYTSDPAFFGSNYPTKTWLAFMKPAMEGQEVKEFDQPDDEAQLDFTPDPTFTESETAPPSDDEPSSDAPPSSRSPSGPPPDDSPSSTPPSSPPDSPSDPPSSRPTKTTDSPRPSLTLPTEPVGNEPPPPEEPPAAEQSTPPEESPPPAAEQPPAPPVPEPEPEPTGPPPIE